MLQAPLKINLNRAISWAGGMWVREIHIDGKNYTAHLNGSVIEIRDSKNVTVLFISPVLWDTIHPQP